MSTSSSSTLGIETLFLNGSTTRRDEPIGWPTAWDTLLAHGDREEKRRRQGFKVLPRRWVVERTFGWLSFHRRFSKGLRVSNRHERDARTHCDDRAHFASVGSMKAAFKHALTV